MVGELPELGIVARNINDGAFRVLVLEHIKNHVGFFRSIANIVKPGGLLAKVMNHPTSTALGSIPIAGTDGQVVWRLGDYLSAVLRRSRRGSRLSRFITGRSASCSALPPMLVGDSTE